MKLLVCIKQVPDLESRFKPNAAGIWYDETDLAWRMNEYDEYAVEQAVRLREKLGDGCDTDRPLHRPRPGGRGDQESPGHGGRQRRPCPGPGVLLQRPLADRLHHRRLCQRQGLRPDLHRHAVPGPGLRPGRGPQWPNCSATPAPPPSSALTMTDGVITAKRELEGGIKGVVKLKTPGAGHLPARAERPALPDPAQYHEGQEERDRRHPGGRPAQGRTAGNHCQLPPPGQKRGRHRPRRGCGESGDKVIAILKDKTAVLR